MENCRGGLHIRPRGVEDAAPYKPKGRTVGSADVRTAAFPQEPICLTREGRACPAPTVQSQLKQEQKPSIMSTTSKSKTMIEGPLAKQILLVSLPLALSNLLQILFNMSDVAVVGRFAGSTALGSVGSTATFVTLFTGFLIGLSNGVNVLVARFYGAGHPKDVSKTVHSALLVSLAAGVLLLFVGLFGSPALLELGSGFDMDLTGTENIFLNGAILGYSEDFLKEKYQQIVDFSELGAEFLDMPLRNYSSGMLARLAFSVATVVEPEVLIVDEVLAVGDADFQKKSMNRMMELMSGGTTVLFVSHNIEQIRKICGKCVWLEHGIVKQVGLCTDICDIFEGK